MKPTCIFGKRTPIRSTVFSLSAGSLLVAASTLAIAQERDRAGAQEQDRTTVTVDERAPRVQIDEAQTRVTAEQQPMDVEVQTGEPQVSVQQPEPEVSVEQPEPEVTIEQAEPQVIVENAEPQVEVNQADPEVTVNSAEPEVRIISEDQRGQQREDRAQQAQQDQQAQQAQAQQTQQSQQAQSQQAQSQQAQSQQTQEQPRDPMNAELAQLQGKTVQTAQGRELGAVEDIVVNQNDGRAGFVASVGGVLGIGDEQIFVPASETEMHGDQIVWQTSQSPREIQQNAQYQPDNYISVADVQATLGEARNAVVQRAQR